MLILTRYSDTAVTLKATDALEEFDARLPEVFEKMREDDLLIITADHGNDPIHHGTDHTREYVPILAYSKKHKKAQMLPLADTFADIGATIADNFQTNKPKYGKSFYLYYNRGLFLEGQN